MRSRSGPCGQKFPTPVAACAGPGIESVNARLRKIMSRERFPSDDAASKLIWQAQRNIAADWARGAHQWKDAMNQFAIRGAARCLPCAA